ncbi:hypothetical protein TcWFU_006330 [Taenia crassiceps]|uniref:Uncharacterized protein n=1 Tax=Taenia crassiceps TaxID=6207 RepID=A0ABR4Q232_9CEST
MLQPLDVEHCLASLSRIVPTLQWWRFELSKPDHRKHLWISLPSDVEVVCGKTSLLPKNSQLLGRLNILHWGADCLVRGIRITPSEKDQIVCIETRASDQDPRIFWIDVNQLVVTIPPNGIQEIVDISRPTQPLLGSRIWGWLSGLQVYCSQSQPITERCFLIPVDFSNRDDIAVLLSHNTKGDRVTMREPVSPSRKLVVVNPRTNELYSCRLDSTPTCQTYSPFGNGGPEVKKKKGVMDEDVEEEEVAEEDEELAFPVSMMDEEATKRDTKLSETLVEIEDFLCRVIWTIEHPSDGCAGRDANIEAQRCRIAMQLAEMQSCEEDLRSNASLSLLEKLLGVLTNLLEIGEMVNIHRRRDGLCILRFVDQNLPELASWADKSQLEEGNVPLPQARRTLNQLACIQSAMQIFVGKAKSTADLEATTAKVKVCLEECLKREIQAKLEEDAPCHEVGLKAEDILTAFAKTMKEYLSFHPTSAISQLEKSSNPLQTLQNIRSNLAVKMAALKNCCRWIPFILSEGIHQSLGISRELLTDLKAIHDQAFAIYKQMEMYILLVCEHSGLYTLAVRLTNILERSTEEKLSQWQISQLEQELDRCEAECAVEILSSGKENHAFLHMVVRSILEYASAARKVLDGASTIQEPELSKLLERFESLTSTSNLPSPSAFFEALLIGWYLQTRSTTDSRVDELVCRLEREVSMSLQDTPLVHLRVSEMEEFFSQMSPISTPRDAEASSLRNALLILSDVVLRLNSAVQLLEQMAFLTNLHQSQRLETLRLSYPRTLEGLTRCIRALEALLRELSEWRKCIILVEESDQHDAATQAVIEIVNFAMSIITQELQNVAEVKFFNIPSFLSKILEWLTNFHSSLLGFRKTSCQYRLEKSAIYGHSSALLHDLLNLEWLLAESRPQSQRGLPHGIGGTAVDNAKTSWVTGILKILEEIEPTKRRWLLNLLEGMERSSREQRQSLLELLMGSWEMVEISEGATLLNYIIMRAEGFTDLKIQLLEEKYANTEDHESNICEKYNSNMHGETFYMLVKNISEEFGQRHDKQSGILDDLRTAECLQKAEIIVKIGHQYVAASKSSLHFIDHVLFSHWPETLLKLIATGQSRGGKKAPADWRICALNFRNTVANCLVRESLGIAMAGLPRVEPKDVDETLTNLRTAIEEADIIFHGIHDDFSVDTKDVWQTCLRLYDLFQNYTSQLGQQINELTIPSLCAAEKDLQRLDYRISELAQEGSSTSALEDCSQHVAHLEESLQALRQTARILFTCLAINSKLSTKVAPSKHLDVNELYKRAVKLVNDYEASEIGCQILEAWRHLQSIADKLGRLQAGLPLTESFSNHEVMTAQSPIASTSDIHLDGFSSASMARKRSWSLLEILGSHECLYPGCRGQKRDKHESRITDAGLIHDLHSFYSLLCSELNDRATLFPVEFLTSNTQKAASSEFALMNLRQEWHRDMDLVNRFNSLQKRVEMDDSGSSKVKSSFGLIKAIWGETTSPKAFFEAAERLATVSSWLCEVERHLDLDVLPRLQTAWKNSAGTDTLSVVEECVYKMNEIAEDLEGLEKGGILAKQHLQTVKRFLQAGWLSVREFLLNRCVRPAFHEDPTSARYFPLVDDFLRHSTELGFQDCGLKATHTRLCNQYLLHGLSQREYDPVEGKRKFCSTNRSLRLLFLPSWLTERCRIVQHRPPIALTIHSIPDVSTELHPSLSSTTELAFHSPKCAVLQSRRWFSLPNIRSQSRIRQDYMEKSFSIVKDEVEANLPQETSNEVEMKTSQLSFSAFPSDEENVEAEDEDEEPTILEDLGDSVLKQDVQIPPTQPKYPRLPATEVVDVVGDQKVPEPRESEEAEKGRCSSTLTSTECHVSRKLRDKSPITWCTVYLPNDEEVVPSIHADPVTERGVIQVASDPLMPKCELYAPMVFSAPYEMSKQQNGQVANGSEVVESIGGLAECSASVGDDSGVCDWLRNQQAENIERLMKECEVDDEKEDMSLTEMDDPSTASGLLELSFPRAKSSVSNSFEESGFADDGWPRGIHEVFVQKTSYSIFAGGTENRPFNETKGSQVNWGPLVERPESPHLSVISEASTDESALEKQNSIDERLQNSPLEIYKVEEHDNCGERKTVASRKTKSRRSWRTEKKGQEEDEEKSEFFSSLPKSSISSDSKDEHAVLTPTQPSFIVEDGHRRIQPQEDDSEEDTDKTISEAMSSEVREKENESDKSSHISMKGLSHSFGDSDTEIKKKEAGILEDLGDSVLKQDVQIPPTQPKYPRLPATEVVDVVGDQKVPEPRESEEAEKGRCSSTLTSTECHVSRKLRDKSPITWCTVYLPNDEEVVPSIHADPVTERGVIQVASDPLMPKCELYAPMVFSAPYEMSKQQNGQVANGSEVVESIGGLAECSASVGDDSGVCDWLRNQQAENIERLMKECEVDDEKEDMSLTEMDDPSTASGLLELPLLRTKNCVSNSFEESGFGDEEWSRRSHEFPSRQTSDSMFVCGVEDYLVNEPKGGRVDWGLLVERPESPHLSAIFEACINESTQKTQKHMDGKAQKLSQASETEESDNSGGLKTVAHKKTRWRKNRDVRNKCEEEGTQRLSLSPPEISTFWNGEDECCDLTLTPIGFVVNDESLKTKLQGGNSEEAAEKVISEAVSSEVRAKEDESTEALQKSIKSSTDSAGDVKLKEEQFQEGMMEHRKEGLDLEIPSAKKINCQITGKNKGVSGAVLRNSARDRVLAMTSRPEVGNRDYLEPRYEPKTTLEQRDAARVYKQAGQEVNLEVDEPSPRENVAATEVREQASGEDLDRQSGKIGFDEGNDEIGARESVEILNKHKMKIKKSLQESHFKFQLVGVAGESSKGPNMHESVKFEDEFLADRAKGDILSNGFQSVGEVDEKSLAKPNEQKEKEYQELQNDQGVGKIDDPSSVKGYGNSSSEAGTKSTRKTQTEVTEESTSTCLHGNAFNSTFADIVEDGFDDKLIYNGFQVCVPRSDDEAKLESNAKREHQDGEKVGEVMRDIKGMGSCLQRRDRNAKATESRVEGVHSVHVNEPFMAWNDNQSDPVVLADGLGDYEMDRQNIGSGLELTNQKVQLVPRHVDGLSGVKAKQMTPKEEDPTKGSGEEGETERDQVVGSIEDIQDSNDLVSAPKEYTCRDPGQTVCIASKMNENGPQSEAMSLVGKGKKKSKRYRVKRHFDGEAGSEAVATNEKVQVNNKAVLTAIEFKSCAGEDGSDKEANNQLDLPDLEEESPEHQEQSYNSVGRKWDTDGDVMEGNGEERVNPNKAWNSCGLEKTDVRADFLPLEGFEKCVGNAGKEEEVDKSDQINSEMGSEGVYRESKECAKNGGASQERSAEGCDTLHEINQFETLQKDIVAPPPKVSESHSIKSGKRRHRKRRHLMEEAEVGGHESPVFRDSQEVSSTEAEVDLKPFEATSDVGYSMLEDETKSALDTIRDGQGSASEIEEPTGQKKDESAINECTSKAADEIANDSMGFGRENAVKHLHATRSRLSGPEEGVEMPSQAKSDVEGVNNRSSPLTNKEVLRDGTKADAEVQERPSEDSITSDEMNQSETLGKVDELSSVGELGASFMKGGRRRKHRKGEEVAIAAKVEDGSASTVFPSEETSSSEAAVDLKAFEVVAGVECPMQVEEFEGTLGIAGDDREPVSGIENQLAIVLDETPQPVEHESVVSGSRGQPKDGLQISECILEVQDESANAFEGSSKVNAVECSHEPKMHSLKHADGDEGEEEHLQDESYAEGTGVDLQPQVNKDFLGECTREDAEYQKDPAEVYKGFDEICHFETTPMVDALPSAKVPEAPSVKGGKRNKKVRKAGQLLFEAETQEPNSSTLSPAKAMTDMNSETAETTVDEQNSASDLVKEIFQPVQHATVMKESPERLEDWAKISNNTLEAQDECVDDSGAIGKSSDLVSTYESKQPSVETERREEYRKEGDYTHSEWDVGGICDELQPQTNKEALETSTKEKAEMTNGSAGGGDDLDEVVEFEGNQFFSGLSSRESEGTSVWSKADRRHRNEGCIQGEGEVKTSKLNADIEHSLDNAASEGGLVSDALEEISQPNENEFEEEKTGQSEAETQLNNHELGVQDVNVDEPCAHSAVEEGSEYRLGEGVENGPKPQKSKDTLREYRTGADMGLYKCCSKIVEAEAIGDVGALASSQEPEAPLMKRRRNKKERKRKQLLCETEVAVGVELPLQPEKDKTALDVATGSQETVPGIDEYSTMALEKVAQPSKQAFAVKESFCYRKDESRTTICEVEIKGDLIGELKGVGEAKTPVYLADSELHPVWCITKQKHFEDSDDHLLDETGFEGVGGKSQVQTNKAVFEEIAGECEDSHEYPTKAEGNWDGSVATEARQIGDTLSSLREPEELSTNTGDGNQHREAVYLHDEGNAQEFQISTAPRSRKILSSYERDEIVPARRLIGEQGSVFSELKETVHLKEHEAAANEFFGSVKDRLQFNDCNLEVQGKSTPESKSPIEDAKSESQPKKQHEERDAEGAGDELHLGTSNDENEDEINQSETLQKVADVSSAEQFAPTSMRGKKKKKKHRGGRNLGGEAEVEDSTASIVPASQETSCMKAEVDLKTSEEVDDVRCQLQLEEAEEILEMADDDQEPVYGIEKQPIIFPDEVSQPVEQEFVFNEWTARLQNEPKVNECECEVTGETLNELMDVRKDNAEEYSHELGARPTEHEEGLEEQLQAKSDVEGVNDRSSPLTNKEVLRDGTKADAEVQERPSEDSITSDEMNQSETLGKVDELSSVGNLERPS